MFKPCGPTNPNPWYVCLGHGFGATKKAARQNAAASLVEFLLASGTESDAAFVPEAAKRMGVWVPAGQLLVGWLVAASPLEGLLASWTESEALFWPEATKRIRLWAAAGL